MDGLYIFSDWCKEMKLNKIPNSYTDVFENILIIKMSCGLRNVEGIGFQLSSEVNEAQYGEFPWMVAVLKETKAHELNINVFQCGGSLIHPEVVLTAASCVDGQQANTLKIRAGEWDTQSKDELFPHQDMQVEEIVIHGRYQTGDLANNIALLFLKSPVDLLENVQTICLPPKNTAFDQSKCILTGWGKSAILSLRELSIITREQCQSSLRKTNLGEQFELDENLICAGEEAKGNVGSPLICPIAGTKNQYYQAGVLGSGIDCCQDTTPGINANLPLFRDWIDDKMALHQLDTKFYNP